jgi:hypothetical protein
MLSVAQQMDHCPCCRGLGVRPRGHLGFPGLAPWEAGPCMGITGPNDGSTAIHTCSPFVSRLVKGAEEPRWP